MPSSKDVAKLAAAENAGRLRSRAWFDNAHNPGMTAIYIERYPNYGITRDEMQSGKPIIGIAQTGSDLSPCNRHHLDLEKRVRDGIRDAGGVPFVFPVHPIQESCRRPTAAIDRNLAYLGLVEVLHGYPLDGVVLTTGCDKTTPACLMAAATVNIPAIVYSGGPMLNSYYKGELAGSGMALWDARRLFAAGEIDRPGFMEMVAASVPSAGHCNTMGTATSMNSLAEALGMKVPTRELVEMAREKVVELTLDRDVAKLPASDTFVKCIATGERAVEITYDKDRTNAGEVLASVQAQGFAIVDVTTREADLEDVFVSLTSGSKVRT